MYEIELKAHINNKKLVETKLKTFATYKFTTEKKDTYWVNQQGNTLRVREEENNVCCTFKNKKIVNDIEVNEEKEFFIKKNKENLEEFLKICNFYPKYKKCKITQSYQYQDDYFGNITIELSYIDLLGDFIEIEIISNQNDKDYCEKAQEKLYQILKLCDIDKSNIETKYYNQMIQEKLSKKTEEK